MISKAASYAIQALTYLAIHKKEREFIPISEIAEELSIPYHFLKKILAALAQSDMLDSQRSSKGGMSMAKDAASITLMDVIRQVDGDTMFSECILKLPGCGEQTPCALHNSWAAEKSRMILMFTSTTLQDVANRVETKKVRIGV